MHNIICSYHDCRWERKYIFKEVITSCRKYRLQRYHAAVVIHKHVPALFLQKLWSVQALHDLHCSVQTPPCSYFSSKKKISYYFGHKQIKWEGENVTQTYAKKTQKSYCFNKQNPMQLRSIWNALKSLLLCVSPFLSFCSSASNPQHVTSSSGPIFG